MNYVILIIDISIVILSHQINIKNNEKDIYNKWGSKVWTFWWKV